MIIVLLCFIILVMTPDAIAGMLNYASPIHVRFRSEIRTYLSIYSGLIFLAAMIAYV